MRWIGRRNRRPPAVRQWWRLLFSATVAAWLQAIGSLIALALTLYLAYDIKNDAHDKAVGIFAATLKITDAAFSNMSCACGATTTRRHEWPALIAGLDDAQEALRLNPIADLPAELSGRLLTLRSFVAMGKGALQATGDEDRPDQVLNDCLKIARVSRQHIAESLALVK
jgi:hypothetical protein